MTTAAGLVLALLSTFALNWGWLAQHGAASELPPLAIRRPLHSLRLLFADRSWLVGFLAGIGGWVLYVVALVLAPLSLVQATSAGGIGLLAGLAHRRGDLIDRTDWAGVGMAATGLTLIAVSLVGGTTAATHPAPAALAAWLGLSLGVASVLFFGRAGLAAGTLYAAGDVATKGAVFGGAWLVLVPVLLLAHGLAFVALQLGFQRADALETAGDCVRADERAADRGRCRALPRAPAGWSGGDAAGGRVRPGDRRGGAAGAPPGAHPRGGVSRSTRSATDSVLPGQSRRNVSSYGRPASASSALGASCSSRSTRGSTLRRS